MKRTFQTLIILTIIYSCASIPNGKHGLLFVKKKIGIRDTIPAKVSGKILDYYDKFGLKGAEIKLENKEKSYYKPCGNKGEFNFENINPGKYRITASYLGYYTLKDSIELRSGEVIKLKIGLGYDK
jgi:hypothetical protein